MPSEGRLYSGGNSATGPVTEGLHFEVTLIQIYRVALSAGKAQRNHKHHHVHRVDHEGRIIPTTTRAPPAQVNKFNKTGKIELFSPKKGRKGGELSCFK